MQESHYESRERLLGVIERVTFHNPENGFCVLRVKIKDKNELVTLVGNAASVSAGEHIECAGTWHQDKSYGKQFKAQQLTVIPPNTIEGIEKFLGSGLIAGMREKTAKLLIKHFGEEVFSVLEHEPEKLDNIIGITSKQKKQIVESFAEQKVLRDTMVFLQSHGITTNRAIRIYKTYGDQAITKITQNPYRLARDIQSIGFKIADDIAVSLGYELNSIERARAGVQFMLQEYCNHGHCAAPYDVLLEECVTLLNIDEAIIKEALEKEINIKKIIASEIDHKICLFPQDLYCAEVTASNNLKRILNNPLPYGYIDIETAIPAIEMETRMQLALSQKRAIEFVFQHKVAIITGGPGVGKTTIVNSILKILRHKGLSISLCAPTGRAAKRLHETTGLKASTIHRLLGFNPETRSFKFHEDHPLPIDMLVVDESSMIDVMLLQSLLLAIPDHASILFCGDVDQLPSVGSGAILKDMIFSGVIPTVRLTEIFRQAENSEIIINAHRINQGELPLPNAAEQSDFYTIYADHKDDIREKVVALVSSRLPDYMHCNALTDIQVLTPMNRGDLGTVALNNELQKKLNGDSEPKVMRNGFTFSPHDKVIQTVNNYDKEVFNGDMGIISHINLRDNIIKVEFDQRTVEYSFSELNELNLAYAISIHKSQGSEFPVVVILLAAQHYMLLARNLLYTAVTRGKKLVVLIGEKKAMSIAVKNNQDNKRLTKLAMHLRG